MLGLHDNYLVKDESETYILRIYRNEWRNNEEVNFEMELLLYLKSKRAPVSVPILTSHGEPTFSIDSPEGIRQAVLFKYANGHAPEDTLTVEHCGMLGQSVAMVHNLSNSFTSKHQRPELDTLHLIDESIESIKPFLSPNNIDFINAVHPILLDNWPNLPKDHGAFGICLGDVNAKNFHIDKNQVITLFDFDQCGFGYRAFEIAKFASFLQKSESKTDFIDAFLDGYKTERQLLDGELEAIGYFEIVAIIWVMAIHARNANRIGHKYLEDHYWQERFCLLTNLMTQQGIATDTINCIG